MAVRGSIVARSIHHGAVPTANVGRSMIFYTQLLGARLQGMINASVPALQHGYPEVVQFQLADCGAFGLALQYDTIPSSTGMLDGTIWGLELEPQAADLLASNLAKRGRTTSDSSPLPPVLSLTPGFAFQDPDGNTWDVCVRKDGPAATGSGSRIRYASLEATDLRQAEEFYSGQLGLECEVRDPDLLALSVGASGQWLLLRRVVEMSPRSALIQGPHVAFEVNPETFDAEFSSLPRREQYWERETNQVPWSEPWQRVGYFYDPFYNRLALVAP